MDRHMEDGIRPIRPEDVDAEKEKYFPDAIIKIFNREIASNWDGSISRVQQDDVIPLIMVALGVNRDYVFEKGLLNVEPIYRECGWDVEYVKPGYDETYEPFFRFSKKKANA
jgi:hypothetical protein